MDIPSIKEELKQKIQVKAQRERRFDTRSKFYRQNKIFQTDANEFYREVVITTAQLHSTTPELRFWVGSKPARGVSEIRDGEDLWPWSRLEIRLNAFRRSTIPQKQFIIILHRIGKNQLW